MKTPVLRFAVALAVVGLLASVLPGGASADLGGFEITSFHTDLTVEPNGDLAVREVIDVDFKQSRHGIYRTIPVHYTDRFGIGYSLRLTHVDVSDGEGGVRTNRVRRRGRFINIRIGDPDRRVHGRVRYVVFYRVRGALRHFPDFDELYWNSTGHEWNTRILEASANIKLPAAFAADSLVGVAYIGAHGSRSETGDLTAESPGRVSYTATRILRPKEGITLAIAWPPGTVPRPSRITVLAKILVDNWVAIVPFLVAFALWRVYQASGRDPETRSVAVQYEPPPGISPGGLGTIVDERVDTRDITATVVHLAVRGYLTIGNEELSEMWGLKKSDVTVFERSKKSDDGLLAHEKTVLDGVFARGSRVTSHDLNEEFYRKVPIIKNNLYRHLTSQKLFDSNPKSVRNRYSFAGFFAGVVTFGAGAAWALWRGGIMPNALLVPGLAAALVFGVFLMFAPAMPRRTRKGARLRAWALGFEEFARRVEKPRLDTLEARTVFESLLPFAIALGVSAKWASRFEGIYDQEPPHWYYGPHIGRGLSTNAFESSLTNSMSTAATSMLSSPRSSGSGGGGFSGGGGGGGGGGSW